MSEMLIEHRRIERVSIKRQSIDGRSTLKLDRNGFDINKLKEASRHNEPCKLTYTVLTLYLLHVKLIICE